MRTLARFASIIAVSSVLACGQQLVEFAGDGGREDATASDSPGSDAPTSDSPGLDAPGFDAHDAENGDASGQDQTSPDAAEPDAGHPDSAEPDTGSSDSASPDSGRADAGSSDSGLQDGDATSLDAADASPPIVISTDPLNGATNVPIARLLAATFTEAMDPLTIDATTFTLAQGATAVVGAVSYAASTDTGHFMPSSFLQVGTVYTATITTGARSAADTPLANPYTWTFTTSVCGQLPVTLGAASTFGVLAGSTVTNQGPTSVTGDVGVSPGTAVTGFPPGTIAGGAIHAGDVSAANAEASMTTAYNDAAGRTLCAVSLTGNIGGLTLTPGLYKSTSSLAISSGDLTLDAEGDENAVFIFQMASTLTTTAGRQVILSGGASAQNVFWQVGTSATLGSASAFQGTILANQAISLNTGATLQGRALASLAGVTLLSNTIVVP